MGKLTAPRPLLKSDDRTSFDCGQATLNHWFGRHAWGNEKEDASRTYVMVDPDTNSVAGYVSLVTGQIERDFLPKNRQRNKPDPVPIILLGKLAVDQSYQGQGCGVDLLHHALTVALEAAASVGFVGVLTHPIDATAQGFYERWGFESLIGDPKGSMIIYIRDLRSSSAGRTGNT